MVGVSVLLPVRLPAPYLQAALESLLQQTSPPDEILVVAHGCGTQMTYLESTHSSIRVVDAPPEKTFVDVLNLGLQSCAHEYVARLDADDLAHSRRIETQKNALMANQSVALCASPVHVIDAAGDHTGATYPDSEKVVGESALIDRNFIAHSSVMFRRSVALAVGGYQHVPLCEDYQLWLRILANHSLCFLSEPFTDYRIHPGQLTSRRSVPHVAWGALWTARREFASARGIRLSRAQLGHWRWCIAQTLLNSGLRRPRIANSVRAG